MHEPALRILALSFACVFASAAGGYADVAAAPPYADPLDRSNEFRAEVVASGLDNPCGLSVRIGSPATGRHQLYFSESGAGRIATAETHRPGKLSTAIGDFPTGPWMIGTQRRMGPMGTVLVTNGTLAVGCGGGDRGPATIRVYRLESDDADSRPVKYEEFDHEVTPSVVGPAENASGSQLFGLAHNDVSLLAVGAGNDGGDWVLKATITSNKLADLQPFINAYERIGIARPLAAVIDQKHGNGYLLVGQMGEIGDERDSHLAFYAPGSGRLAVTFAAGLFDVVALAYCPSSGNLYAVDAAWHDPEAGGVYRLDAALVDGQQSCQPVKIANCAHPTSLGFTPAGAIMFVTAFGDGGEERSGQLLKITGGF